MYTKVLMKKLNNIISRICSSNRNRDVILYEHFSSYISESLNYLNITHKSLNNLRLLTKLDSDKLLLLCIDENTLNHKEIYGEIGSIILKHPSHIILINKSDENYLENKIHQSLMSLGFKLNAKNNHDDVIFLFYTYNISDYKNTPDWLNSDNWANPKLWEK